MHTPACSSSGVGHSTIFLFVELRAFSDAGLIGLLFQAATGRAQPPRLGLGASNAASEWHKHSVARVNSKFRQLSLTRAI